MKKTLLVVFFAATIAICAIGCNTMPSPQQSEASSSAELSPASSTDSNIGIWEEMHASFTREDSSQYNNATLMMKYLDNSCALFEFRLMEGSEVEDFAVDTILSGVLTIGDDGTGTYETIPDAENPFSIHFTLSEDRQSVAVTHDGALLVSPDGRYLFVDHQIEVSDTSVGEILGFLPTAATSLNSTLGAYTIGYPDALISDWFYSVEAVFDDSGAVLAKFLIAKDLSAVFRTDDDIEPVMIFGTAQPMMEATIMKAVGSSSTEGGEGSTGCSTDDEPTYEPSSLVTVTLDSGTYLTPGMSGKLTAFLPADLPYTLSAKSLDESVMFVDATGGVTAVGNGKTEIQCVITCEDGTATIHIPVCVTDTLEFDTVITQ